MYAYKFVEINTDNFFSASNHREIIEEYSKNGWRFVSAIPTSFKYHNGKITKIDLVFEKINN